MYRHLWLSQKLCFFSRRMVAKMISHAKQSSVFLYLALRFSFFIAQRMGKVVGDVNWAAKFPEWTGLRPRNPCPAESNMQHCAIACLCVRDAHRLQ
jgi:hypothetical protein